mmetsp:Transcript_3357/g.8313  ORF Transcript_3357/g.8313 Transcript_3357/m.8313 type:complete len:484 (+) Transcript_3357:1398-2849(+)
MHQLLLRQRLQRGQHGETAHEFRDQPVVDHVRVLHLLGDLRQALLVLVQRLAAGDRRPKADRGLAHALVDDLLQAHEGTPADEEDVLRVHLDVLHARVLLVPFFRDVHHGALQHLEQRLLHPFPGHVPRGGGPRPLGHLVDLVDVHDPALRQMQVVAGRLQELAQDVFHVLSHVTRLGQRRGVGKHQRHVHQLGEALRQQRLPAAGGAQHQDVRLLRLHVLVEARPEPALHVALLPGAIRRGRVAIRRGRVVGGVGLATGAWLGGGVGLDGLEPGGGFGVVGPVGGVAHGRHDARPVPAVLLPGELARGAPRVGHGPAAAAVAAAAAAEGPVERGGVPRRAHEAGEGVGAQAGGVREVAGVAEAAALAAGAPLVHEADALVVVVDGHAEHLLGLVLPDDVLVQDGQHLRGGGDGVAARALALAEVGAGAVARTAVPQVRHGLDRLLTGEPPVLDGRRDGRRAGGPRVRGGLAPQREREAHALE